MSDEKYDPLQRLRKESQNNSGMKRTSSNIQVALPKVREPMSTLDDKNIPYDYTDEKELIEIRRWARLFYATHDLVPLLVDIYAKFPTAGMSLTCKDPKVTEFYEDLFFNTLNYETFIQDIGREFFTVGECTTLAHFDDLLGTWSSEEILNPDQLIVTRPLFQKNEQVLLKVTDLVEGLRDPNLDESDGSRRQKQFEYETLNKYYPELIEAANQDEGLPLSDALVSRMVNKTSYWDLRGTPHMLRSFRTLIMEESLNAAQDAVSDRLYSPFILAKLGIQNIDGSGQPWIPTPEDLNEVRDDMQAALSADFRLMVHHFGLDVNSVFGRESVPRFDNDYNRIDEKLLQAWGIGKALISGGTGGPYASSAVNREFVTQMMSSFQSLIKRHMKKRMEVIAEAQGHYDYDLKGGVRKPVMQEVVEEDPETGERYIVEAPKLLVPDVEFSTINLRDEAQERQFLQTLKNMGVPVSDESLAVNIPISFEEELEKTSQETVKKYIAQSQSMVKAKELLEKSGLPLPPELASFFEASTINSAPDPSEKDPNELWDTEVDGVGGVNDLTAIPGGGETSGEGSSSSGESDSSVMDEVPEGESSSNTTLPRNKARPDESDEMRGTEPRTSLRRGPSSLGYRFRVSKSEVSKSIQSGADIELTSLLHDEDLQDILGVGQFSSTYDLFEDELTTLLHNNTPEDEVEGDLQESYTSLRNAVEDYRQTFGGEVLW